MAKFSVGNFIKNRVNGHILRVHIVYGTCPYDDSFMTSGMAASMWGPSPVRFVNSTWYYVDGTATGVASAYLPEDLMLPVTQEELNELMISRGSRSSRYVLSF